MSAAQAVAARELLEQGGDSWEVFWHRQGTKTGKCSVRYEIYRRARTFGEFKALHASHADGTTWWADLKNDLISGKTAVRPRDNPSTPKPDQRRVARAAVAPRTAARASPPRAKPIAKLK